MGGTGTYCCRVCHSESARHLFDAPNIHGRHLLNDSDRFPVYVCESCDSLFIGGLVVDSAYYRTFYAESYYDDSSRAPSWLSELANALGQFSFWRKERILSRYIQRSPKKVLDIGCGTGAFLSYLQQRGWECYGTEIHPEGYRLSRAKGITVYHSDFLDTDFASQKFDAISLLHVLEHLPRPIEAFQKIHSLLNEGGIVLCAVPNRHSFGCLLGQSIWFHLDCPRHLFIPSPRTMAFLCSVSGLRIDTRIHECYDYPLDLFWSVRKSPAKFLIYPLYPFVKSLSNETSTYILRKI